MTENKVFTNEENTIKLEVTEDYFEAYLTITNCNDFINEKEIVKLLDSAQIKFGWDNAKKYIEEHDSIKEFGKPFLIARGDRFIEASVEFEILFPEENNYSADTPLTDLENLVKVKADKPLAHLFITREEIPGKDIMGNLIESGNTSQEVIESYLGENVYYSEERSQVYSKSSGYPYLKDGRIHVKSDFEIDSDIGINFTNFSLYGNLKVDGNITDKIQINVQGNLYVNGDVNDADLTVQGSVTVKGDIINSSINAEGNINIENAENSYLFSAKKVFLNGHCNFTRIITEKGLSGDKDNSTVVGGIIQSGDNIELAVIGNSSYINTEVEIAISPFLKNKMLSVNKKIVRLKDSSYSNPDEIAVLEDELHILEAQFEEKINDALFSEDEVPKHITIYKKIFGGTYLRILKKSTTITDNLEKVSFSVIDGELVKDSFS